MIKKLKIALLSLSAVLVFGTPLLIPAIANAQDASTGSPSVSNGLCQGANLQATPGDTSSATCDVGGQAATDKVNSIITLVINVFSFVVGLVSVIMIIVGGLMYVTSAGDSGKVTNAKNTILYAIIGLVVVALSQFIVKFVLSKLGGPGTSG